MLHSTTTVRGTLTLTIPVVPGQHPSDMQRAHTQLLWTLRENPYEALTNERIQQTATETVVTYDITFVMPTAAELPPW